MPGVTTVSYSVNFNDESVGPISPRRELRQGDPLSAYLFLLYVEGLGLSNDLVQAVANGEIHDCKISGNAPPVTH